MKTTKFQIKTLKEKRRDAVRDRYKILWKEGWREDIILNKLGEEFFLLPSTLVGILRGRATLKKEADKLGTSNNENTLIPMNKIGYQ